jgi:hypothetical protein
VVEYRAGGHGQRVLLQERVRGLAHPSIETLTHVGDRLAVGGVVGEVAGERDVGVAGLGVDSDRGLVEHEPPYWSAADDDRLAALTGTMLSMQAFEERYGDDEFSDWHDSDVDPRDNR